MMHLQLSCTVNVLQDTTHSCGEQTISIALEQYTLKTGLLLISVNTDLETWTLQT